MKEAKCVNCGRYEWVDWCAWVAAKWVDDKLVPFPEDGEICAKCFDALKVKRSHGTPGTISARGEGDGASPGQENAIRQLEDG